MVLRNTIVMKAFLVRIPTAKIMQQILRDCRHITEYINGKISSCFLFAPLRWLQIDCSGYGLIFVFFAAMTTIKDTLT